MIIQSISTREFKKFVNVYIGDKDQLRLDDGHLDVFDKDGVKASYSFWSNKVSQTRQD